MKNLTSNVTVESLTKRTLFHLKYSRGKTLITSTKLDKMMAFSHAIRDLAIDGFINTQSSYLNDNPRRVNYLSMEYLIGKMLENNIYALGVEKESCEALKNLNTSLDEVLQFDVEAGLGNGGLGRLASCYLDSLASLELPAYGYGIRYEHGIFKQEFENGWQREKPDEWLSHGYPWEMIRPEYTIPICVYGHIDESHSSEKECPGTWSGYQIFEAVPYDVPIIGSKKNTVNMLRLWKSQASEVFQLDIFNQGDYVKAVEEKNWAENVTKVLYPSDFTYAGKELRLIQEYFLAASSIRDIIRRYKKNNSNLLNFYENNVIQLNDTHPTLAIVELMRILHDEEGIKWENAWNITTKTFCYTNHTLLAEALEKWSVELLTRVLPRHMQLIFKINESFLKKIEINHSNDIELIRKVSLIEEGDQQMVRMANLCVIGSNKVNGVSALHSQLLKDETMPEFNRIFPNKFCNVTNGITHRRWLVKINPQLSSLINDYIGDCWIQNLDKLKEFEKFVYNEEVQQKYAKIKQEKKNELVSYIKEITNEDIDPNSIFDVQIKRLHMYKRQLLKVMHIIHLYHKIKNNELDDIQPRTFIFAAKAAPAYLIAKSVIKLINTLSDVINNDPEVNDKIKIIFLPNYNVSIAEKIIPAADISEQISTAGFEASGTGNMKLSLNGALTVGTWDGANIEIAEHVGEENIFIFGKRTEDLKKMKAEGYNPWRYINSSEDLKLVLESIRENIFDKDNPDLFKDLYHELTDAGDFYFYLADYKDYIECNKDVDKLYQNKLEWTKKSLLNIARMGWFTSDRSINDYNENIWHLSKKSIEIN